MPGALAVRRGSSAKRRSASLPEPLVVSNYVTGVVHTERSLDSWGNPTAIAAGRAILPVASDYEVQHVMGFGTTTPSVDSTHRDYVASNLDDRVTDVMVDAGVKVIVFALAPAWMREVPAGVTPIDDFTPEGWYYAPVHATHLAEWADLCADIATTYSDVDAFFVWNEMKGHFLSGPQRWDYERYTTMYNAVWTAVKAVRPDALIGGPYTNLSTGGPASIVQHPAWGWVDQRILDVIDYWMANKLGADMLVVDGTNSVPNGLDTIGSEFGKFRDFYAWFRAKGGEAATLPIWIAEHYAYPPGASLSSNSGDIPKYPAFWAIGTMEVIGAGYGPTMLWGPQGFDNDTDGISFPLGLYTDTQMVGGGQPTALTPIVELFHDTFVTGQPVWRPDTGNTNIVGLGTATKCILANRANSSQSTSGFTPPTTLSAYEVRAVTWTPAGYTPYVEPDPGPMWVATFNQSYDLKNIRGTFTVSGGKARAGSTSTECIVTYGGAYNVTDQYAETSVTTFTGSGSYTGVALRCDDLGRYYLPCINGSGQAEIYYYDGSSYSFLTSTSYTLGTLPGTLRGEMQGTTIRLYWRGSLILSTTHAAIASGTPAAYINCSSSLANVEIEYLEADVLAGAPVAGTANSSFTFTSTAIGTVSGSATINTALTFTATAVGTVTVPGVAATSLTFAATAAGTVTAGGAQWSDDFTSTAGLTVVRGSVSAVSGKLRGGATSQANMAHGSTVTDTANHYSQVVISTLTGATSEAGVYLRYTTGSGAYYLGIILPGGGGTAEMYYFNGSFYSLLTSGSVTVGTLPGTLRGEVDGAGSNNLRLYWRGSLILQTTHSTLTTGKPGAYVDPATSVANSELDSWEADTI